jgi:hypothetical protein
VIGVDCLVFDLKVCSGTQVQTLRFAFPTKVCIYAQEPTYRQIDIKLKSVSKKKTKNKSRAFWKKSTSRDKIN